MPQGSVDCGNRRYERWAIVDSSALTEQVVVDVLASAFDSAGQRCSALRVLCVCRTISPVTYAAENVTRDGECRMWGIRAVWTTDIGPVIDSEKFQKPTRNAGIQAGPRAKAARWFSSVPRVKTA